MRLGQDVGLAITLWAMHALGIDIGGTGIKAAPVDVATGKLLAERQKIATPRPALPDALADVVKQLTTSFKWSGPIGITFPGVVIDGKIRTAANLDPAWIGVDAGSLFAKVTDNPVRVLNDADAAGVAETRASEHAKDLHELSWGKWAGRVEEYLQHVEAMLAPHLFIVGGGISKESEKWVPRLTGISARIVPATLLNNAGIVGAAMSTASNAAPDTSGATGVGN